MEKSTKLSDLALLRALTYKGAEDKKVILTNTVTERIESELFVIEKLDCADRFILYFRIVEICNELNWLRSCGRGKAINSMVNYCLDITKIDPIAEDLSFENFMRIGQDHLPDIDIDVAFGFDLINGYQNGVIERLAQKHPEYYIYPIAILIENDVEKYKSSKPKGTIFDHDVPYRRHPCGTIVTSEKIINATFFYEGQEFYRAHNKDNDPIFKNYKVDIIGLDYLERLQCIVDEIGEEYHPSKLPLNDREVFDFFASGDLKNIFMFDAIGFDQIFTHVKPNSTSDLSKINLMIHPNSSKLHSLSYSILGYWGCFYKVHFPKEFERAFQ